MIKDGFQKVAWRLDPALIVTGGQSPLSNFFMPAAARNFYHDLKEQRARRGEEIEQAFLYGGSIGDIHKGIRPKDYDLNLTIPKMIERLKAAQHPTQGMRSYKDMEEDVEIAIGYDFPGAIIDGLPNIKNHALFGDYIEIPVNYYGSSELTTMDVRIVSNRVDPVSFISYFHAPIMAIAVSMEEPQTFTYHSDYADHLDRNIMQVDGPVPMRLAHKAQRKGMTLVTPGGP